MKLIGLNRCWFSVLLISLSLYAYPSEKALSTKPWTKALAHNHTVFMSAGPREYDNSVKEAYTLKGPTAHSAGTFFRVHFALSEIYYSIIVEEMAFFGEEGRQVESKASYFISGREIGENTLPLPRLTHLQFSQWESWNTFVLKEKTPYCVFKSNQTTLFY